VASSCAPHFDFLTEQEILVSTCTGLGAESGAGLGAGKLVLMRTNGRLLWEAQTSDTTLWPLVVRAPDGTRLAREALAVAHPVKSHSINQDEITGQLVEVLDAADGKVVLEASASPALDAGGNLAISPSGRRVAILNNGAIQVFELPPPASSAHTE
jgi:hypothetical protein